MSTPFPVELVAVEERVWQGQATFVYARTLAGEIGILAHHIPVMAQLVEDGRVEIETVAGERIKFAVNGGFLSVSEDGVTILAEEARRVTGAEAAQPAGVGERSL
jgi:F-type H+-transporting ATPase subunit epsilon